jgi:hypothetical protein
MAYVAEHSTGMAFYLLYWGRECFFLNLKSQSSILVYRTAIGEPCSNTVGCKIYCYDIMLDSYHDFFDLSVGHDNHGAYSLRSADCTKAVLYC